MRPPLIPPHPRKRLWHRHTRWCRAPSQRTAGAGAPWLECDPPVKEACSPVWAPRHHPVPSPHAGCYGPSPAGQGPDAGGSGGARGPARAGLPGLGAQLRLNRCASSGSRVLILGEFSAFSAPTISLESHCPSLLTASTRPSGPRCHIAWAASARTRG